VRRFARQSATRKLNNGCSVRQAGAQAVSAHQADHLREPANDDDDDDWCPWLLKEVVAAAGGGHVKWLLEALLLSPPPRSPLGRRFCCVFSIANQLRLMRYDLLTRWWSSRQIEEDVMEPRSELQSQDESPALLLVLSQTALQATAADQEDAASERNEKKYDNQGPLYAARAPSSTIRFLCADDAALAAVGRRPRLLSGPFSRC